AGCGAGAGSAAGAAAGSGAGAGAASGCGVTVVVVVVSLVTAISVSGPGVGGGAWSPMLGRVMPSVTPVVIRLFSMPIGPSACLSVGITVFLGLASSTMPVGGAGITCVAVSTVVVVVVWLPLASVVVGLCGSLAG